MNMVTTAGNHGEGIRSDCFVNLDLTGDKDISVEIKSMVKSMYGSSIQDLCLNILGFYGIRHAKVTIDDTGALPFTIAARLEAAIKKNISTDKEYLMPVLQQNIYSLPRDADRMTRLYIPGNNPKQMINAGIYGSNGIILDLEDSVTPDKKFEARFLVRNALRAVDFYGAERMVRINPLPAGLDDLHYCIPHYVNMILIPKCEHAVGVEQVDEAISSILGEKNTTIHLMPIIESATGVMNAFNIARASQQVAALAIGLEDYTTDISAHRTTEGRETFFARSMIVNAARAAGIQPIDSVFSDIDDMDALSRVAQESKSLGFAGMGCIHPRQIPVINRIFLPDDKEIEKAKRIVLAYEEAEKEGSGVVALDSKMIDLPVVKRALRIIDTAIKSGIFPKDWREQHG